MVKTNSLSEVYCSYCGAEINHKTMGWTLCLKCNKLAIYYRLTDYCDSNLGIFDTKEEAKTYIKERNWKLYNYIIEEHSREED